MTGQRFGYLTALERADDWKYPNGSKRKQWRCLCDCGNIITVKHNDLVSGHTKSCGCYNLKKISERRFIDLSGMRFGKLTVIQRTGTLKKTETASTPVYLCRCDCGNTVSVRADYLESGDKKSCGCLISQGENRCEKILKDNRIKYEKQKEFPDLLSNKGFPLRFDFCVYDNEGNISFLLEYQGPQHKYKSNIAGKFVREISDPLKKNYCSVNNIPLEEIWFNESVEDSLTKLLTKYLHANPVPSLENEEGATTISQESTDYVKLISGSAVPHENG